MNKTELILCLKIQKTKNDTPVVIPFYRLEEFLESEKKFNQTTKENPSYCFEIHYYTQKKLSSFDEWSGW